MTKESDHDAYFLLEEAKQKLLTQMASIIERRWNNYLVSRDPNEPHDESCQVTRYPNSIGVACTCASNATRRRAAIIKAGEVNDQVIYHSLGEAERVTWRYGFNNRWRAMR